MKIDLKRISKKDIEQLLLDKEMNIAAAQGLFDYCFYTRDNHIEASNLISSCGEYLELNLNNEEDKYFFDSRIKPSIKQLNNEDYDSDYYWKNIHPKEYKDKEYSLEYLKFKPNQLFPYDDIEIDKSFKEVSRIGYFTKPFSYLAVLKQDVVWMSLDPNEINTMRPSIEKAKGITVAFGLGLGYFPIMCAKKKEVNKVIVVEKDQNIIDIFKKHILPLFAYKDKIEIVHDDAFNYVKRIKNIDFLFIDIWHNPEDGLPLYLKFFRLLKNKNIEVDYWLEKSLLAMHRRCLLTVIEESLLGYSDKQYQKSKNDYDKIINELYFKTKNMTFSSIDEIKQLLQDNSLKPLI